jgi:alanine dehydrogenase
MSTPLGSVLLTASDVRSYLTMERCMSAVSQGFRLLGAAAGSDAVPPVTVGIGADGGGFHIKAGIVDLGRKYFAAKANGNFPGNPLAHGLPTIQGLVLLCDATNGSVLAVIDSAQITAMRTAAATGLAAGHLARTDAAVAAICGCGRQAASQIEALRLVRPISKVVAVDADAGRAEAFAHALAETPGVECTAGTLADAARADPDVWITCTTSTRFFLFPEHVKDGAFVAGVGVDNEEKRELAPALLRRAHVVADLVSQCERIGDLHHAMAAGTPPLSVRELGLVAAGRETGRRDETSVHVFDSTGVAVQDVAACAAVFEAACAAEGSGARLTRIDFAA